MYGRFLSSACTYSSRNSPKATSCLSNQLCPKKQRRTGSVNGPISIANKGKKIHMYRRSFVFLQDIKAAYHGGGGKKDKQKQYYLNILRSGLDFGFEVFLSRSSAVTSTRAASRCRFL